MTKAVAFAAAVALAGPALAGETPVETATLGEAKITLHVHDFLLEDELMALRLVMTNEDALALFVPCLLYTSPSPRDRTRSRMPSSA